MAGAGCCGLATGQQLGGAPEADLWQAGQWAYRIQAPEQICGGGEEGAMTTWRQELHADLACRQGCWLSSVTKAPQHIQLSHYWLDSSSGSKHVPWLRNSPASYSPDTQRTILTQGFSKVLPGQQASNKWGTLHLGPITVLRTERVSFMALVCLPTEI